MARYRQSPDNQPGLATLLFIAVLLTIVLVIIYGCFSPANSQQGLPPDIVAVGNNWVPFLLNTGEFRLMRISLLEKIEPPPVPVTPQFLKDLNSICKTIEDVNLENLCLNTVKELGITGVGKAWSLVRLISPPKDDGCRIPSFEEWDIFHRKIAKSFGTGSRFVEWIMVQIPPEVRVNISQQIRNKRRGCE